MALFREPAPQPERIIEADNESVINNLVESGVGISLIRDEIVTPLRRRRPQRDLAGLASHDEALARLRGGPRDRPAASRRWSMSCGRSGTPRAPELAQGGDAP